jgi:hypothetical protein
MSDLEHRARVIVEAARDADVPSSVDRDRIKRAVLVQIAAGSVLASTAAAGTLSIGAKVGLAVLAVSLVGGGTVGLLEVRSAHRAASALSRVSPPSVPALAPIPLPVAPTEVIREESPAPAAADERARKVEKPRKVAVQNGRAAKGAEEDQLNAEVAVLKRAREELRLGRPAAALEALVEYDQRFGKGVLGEERQAMAAIAACQAEPGPSSRAQAEAFMRRAPASPLRNRVREACITPSRVVSP